MLWLAQLSVLTNNMFFWDVRIEDHYTLQTCWGLWPNHSMGKRLIPWNEILVIWWLEWLSSSTKPVSVCVRMWYLNVPVFWISMLKNWQWWVCISLCCLATHSFTSELKKTCFVYSLYLFPLSHPAVPLKGNTFFFCASAKTWPTNL